MAESAENYQVAQALVAQLQGMKEEGNQIAMKISELDQERHEHSLVIATLQKLDSDRKCYRMIGGVLTERTTGEVLPAVKENMQKLEGVCNDLYARLQSKEKEMQEFQSKHNIRLARPGQPQQKAEPAAAGAAEYSV
eukprot:CAMPEP_0181318698 /NCGR_PEP_ID=MMETSP1101-20121128/17148_1 /TAXON_ID=46948 /ORGANISM="Rhodomonas abbreviata, Strain Caron Lab Isolate" /LENGTH=136 /DNA_ID=CAMNT_0023426191 /DNA_START=74 /DNA_END=484 /DNA_ORIENTATION=+